MYKVEELKENEFSFLELKNASNTASAKILLDQGGRLQELKFDDKVNYWRSKLSQIELAPFNHDNWSML